MDGNHRDRLAEALKKSRADFTDIRLEFIETSSVSFRGGQLETATSGRDVGGIVRALVGGRWGIATFNRLDDLGKRVEEAYACALAAPESDVKLAGIEPAVDEVPVAMAAGGDFRQVDLTRKRDLVRGYSDLILSQPSIRDAMVSFADRFSQCHYASSEGARIYQERPTATLAFGVTARDGDDAQTAFEGVACGLDYRLAQGREEMAAEVAARARALLSAEPVKGGNYTVILGPRMAGLFAHEAFGHLSEADLIADSPKAREMMTLGRRFGAGFLNITDGGAVPGLRGSMKYDDEGTRTGETYLVREGVLVGRLHDRQSAARMGERPTGNARATYYRYEPIVRMTNTRILAGPHRFEDLIGDIKLGVYAKYMGGGQTFLENFSFASGGSYMIRNGKVAELVRDVNFGGNLFSTLANIDGIADDFQWSGSGGGCGKGQEMTLPVGMGAPHVRVRDVLIGGR
jgi:TldD protein